MKFLIALVLALAVVLGTANAASTKCRSPKKNFHIANGEVRLIRFEWLNCLVARTA